MCCHFLLLKLSLSLEVEQDPALRARMGEQKQLHEKTAYHVNPSYEDRSGNDGVLAMGKYCPSAYDRSLLSSRRLGKRNGRVPVSR